MFSYEKYNTKDKRYSTTKYQQCQLKINNQDSTQQSITCNE